MRIKQGLSPMSPSMARLPMKEDSHNKHLDCNTCHTPHEYNSSHASFELCTSCHDDDHTNAYKYSAHFELWQKEQLGEVEDGGGVSCATCHMPREIVKQHGVERVLVQHNQNFNLRPNEKMIRSVCMNCHGLDFSINALADKDLIKRNFNRPPAADIQSSSWVKKRLLERSNK